MEQWKLYPLNTKYSVSNLGRVKNRHNRILKTFKNNNGYETLTIHPSNKTVYLHRLVAITWLGNSDLTVNHKDGNKGNNSVENLEWLSLSENHKHAYKLGLKKARQKTVMCLETGKIYYNCQEASLDTKVPRKAIKKAANPKSLQVKAGGLHWQYI